MNTKSEFLLIDDDEVTIMLSEILLEDFPEYKHINSFLDGSYALDYMKQKYCKDTQYIITLDINMPLMSGWQFLEALQEFVTGENINVFMLSSSTDKGDIEKSEEIDLVKGFFSKPLTEEHIYTMQQQVNQCVRAS